jgi:tRNA (guanine37-N1)-methyltransferase
VRIDIVSIFPDYFAPLELSLVGKARRDHVCDIHIHDLRQWGIGAHRQVDDTPYGGGPGMVMSAEVWGNALDSIRHEAHVPNTKPMLIIPTPSGIMFRQSTAATWTQQQHMIFACGRYEGIDSRVATYYKTHPEWAGVQEVSVGDYVLAGGEVAVLAMVESVTRLLPGVLGNPESARDDSFSLPGGRVEGSVFTRPPTWRELEVPKPLLSGNHSVISSWRSEDSVRRTCEYRPDLLGESPEL